MKILMIMPSYKPATAYGGPVEALTNLAESIAELGHEVTVYTTNANGKVDLEVETGKEYNVDKVKVIYFQRVIGGQMSFSPSLLKRFSREVKKYDVIHIHSWWNLVTMPATWICLSKRIRPFVSTRGTLTEYTFKHRRTLPKRIVHSLKGKKLLEQCVLLFTSNREKEEALKFVHAKDYYVLPNIHKFPSPQKKMYTEWPYLKILYLGRIDPVKNLEFLLRTIVHHLSIPYRLVMAGDGDSQYKNQLMEMGKDTGHIEWVGHLSVDKKYEQLSDADITVLPSFTENYGNVVLESLSQGTPVLISPNVGIKDFINYHALGWVAETKEDVWADILESVWKEKSLLRDIQVRARNIINKELDPLQNAREYINVYSKYIQIPSIKEPIPIG